MQAIPTYSMSSFSLSKKTLARDDNFNGKVWVGTRCRQTENAFGKMERNNTTKKAGGMGFREMHLFNLVMLGKQGWRILTKPNSMR
jgi:hypothetical protein